jgi:acyl dehydratase
VTVAHGFLTLSLLSHFHQSTFTIAPARASLNVGFEKLRFTAPVPAGSRIRSVFKLADVYDVSGGTQLQWAVTIEREGSKRPVLLADWLTRVVE